jgi:hypothetical protein
LFNFTNLKIRFNYFDLEQDWFEDPEFYFKKNDPTKFNMLQELIKFNMKGFDFSEIRRQ